MPFVTLVKLLFVTLHHDMSLNVPHGHFHVIFSESKFYAICLCVCVNVTVSGWVGWDCKRGGRGEGGGTKE